jgi:DNA-directed RNA polymerase subunit RPC12/RpoP
MSEFKFACPICGQHITADSKDTGSQIACPTCFRKIVVPQAPASEESKFVVSASEANRPRPPQTVNPQFEGLASTSSKTHISTGLVILLVLVCAAGATIYVLRGKIFPPKPASEHTADENASDATSQPGFSGPSLWTMDLSTAKIPDAPAAGALRGRAFTLDHAILSGSNLTLRAGRGGPIELGLNIYFFNHRPEDLSGISAAVRPGDNIAPRVVMHWKDAERAAQTFRSGYAMKIEFGPAANGALPGKIFLCLPDESRSWVAGTFRAEIHRPGPPKPRRPAPQSETQ